MSTRSGRIRQSVIELSPPRTRNRASPTRSPARTQKSSPTSRTSARRSPSRKSPSRKTTSNYPARKSPSRTPKDIKDEEKDKPLPKSPAKRPALKTNPLLKLDDITSTLESYRSTRSRRLEYTVKDIPSVFSSESPLDDKLNGFEAKDTITDIYSLRNRKTNEDIAPRRSSRLRDVTDAVSDIRRSFTKSLSISIGKSPSKSIDSYSDEENDGESEGKAEPVIRKLSTPAPSNVMMSQTKYKFDFGGNIGSFLLFIMIPLVVYAILLSCQKSCSHKYLFEWSSFLSLPVWLNNKCTITIFSQYIIQAVFLLLPVFGTKEVGKDGRKYCYNAFFSALCTSSLIFLLDYNKLLKADMFLEYTVQLATVSYLISVFLAIFLYFKSKKGYETELNPYGVTGYKFYQFIVGREIHPHIMKLNIKLWISRISSTSTLILALLLFKRGISLQENIQSISLEEFYNIQSKIILKPTVLVFSMMQIVYALYFIMGEQKITSTFYWQYEGMGYIQLVSSALYPYYYTVISKHVGNSDVSLKTNTLIAASVLYGLGFLIMLISNNIKYEFRKNPLHPSLTYLDSMPTFHGKKLLVSNLWGIVRHPNYAGDILIHISLALPGILTHQVMAAAPALITIAVLVHRAWRDHRRCGRRYGAAWNRYCKRVASVLIPKIL